MEALPVQDHDYVNPNRRGTTGRVVVAVLLVLVLVLLQHSKMTVHRLIRGSS
jgi:hypothetical protein